MTKTITTTISDEFHDLCKEKGIRWNDALRRGIRVLTDPGENDPIKLKAHYEAKITNIRQQLERYSRLYYELKDKLDNNKAEKGV